MINRHTRHRNIAAAFAVPFIKLIGTVMAGNPDTSPGEVTTLIDDVPHAQFVYFDNAPVSGYGGGVITVTLSANRAYLGPDGIVSDHVVTAYLRGNIQAAINLKNAIDRALLMAIPAPGWHALGGE